MLTQPTTLFINVPIAGDASNTHKIAVHIWGDNDAKKTVMCVHGLTRNARDFDTLASALTDDDYRVLCIDIAGRGKSEWLHDPSHYTYPNYAADIGYILANLGIKKLHWIGTSMGGIIGMMVANAFPTILQSLTLNDIGCLIPANGLARIANYVGIPPVFDTYAQAEEELRRRCAPYGIPSEPHWQNLFAHSIEATPNGRFRLTYDHNIAQNLPTAENIKDVDLWSLWDAVKKIPTLLIRGTQSDLLTHETAIDMQKNHPNLTLLEIENVGHAPALMNNQQIDAIKNHLNK